VLSTCFISNIAVELAAIAVVENIATPLRLRVNVPAALAVLATSILVTTVVVEDGTVYRVVLDVAAAARASTFDVVVAINYYDLPIRVIALLLELLNHLY
jgi:hypothetical protein